jgi:hypothetical protein
MRAVNRAIIRERHVIPTVDDIVADLNGCKVFSKVDLKQGYHQIMLHPESRHLTTFSTHVGLWRYKRLNFGMSCSAEIFQNIISDVISGIPGVNNISDDIYIGGKDREEHDQRLRMVLDRLTKNNLRVNLSKCQVRVPSMLFFGHIFSGDGISPDPKKVSEIQSLKAPNTVTEVRSLLSSAAFCARYIKDFATVTRPLRKLTHMYTWDVYMSSDTFSMFSESVTMYWVTFTMPRSNLTSNWGTYMFVKGDVYHTGGHLTCTEQMLPCQGTFDVSRDFLSREERLLQCQCHHLSCYVGFLTCPETFIMFGGTIILSIDYFTMSMENLTMSRGTVTLPVRVLSRASFIVSKVTCIL